MRCISSSPVRTRRRINTKLTPMEPITVACPKTRGSGTSPARTTVSQTKAATGMLEVAAATVASDRSRELCISRTAKKERVTAPADQAMAMGVSAGCRVAAETRAGWTKSPARTITKPRPAHALAATTCPLDSTPARSPPKRTKASSASISPLNSTCTARAASAGVTARQSRLSP